MTDEDPIEVYRTSPGYEITLDLTASDGKQNVSVLSDFRDEALPVGINLRQEVVWFTPEEAMAIMDAMTKALILHNENHEEFIRECP